MLCMEVKVEVCNCGIGNTSIGKYQFQDEFDQTRDVTDQAELYLGTHMENLLSIQEVSERLYIPKSTLRYWELRFGDFIDPQRTAGGQRRYNSDLIHKIEQIQVLKQQGKKISEIKSLFERKEKPSMKFAATADLSVEMLAQRIADLVSNEVSRFLSENEHHTNFK